MKNEILKSAKMSRKDRKDMIQYINLQLASLGQPLYYDNSDAVTKFSNARFLSLTEDLINSFREKARLLSDHLSPVDTRIQNFLNDYLKDVELGHTPQLPNNTFILNQKGLAREMSLAPDGQIFKSKYVTTYRVKQGILNNPANDKRTTKGTFHIVEGGLPVPLDKKEVSKITFARLLKAALKPSDEILTLPFTATQEEQAKIMVSLLMRPVVCPEVKGIISEKSMEVRFFAPASLISNLDFVESIFGNAGDPNLAMNDSALDTEHWTGHTGCIILAPSLTELTKKELGLPHFDDATDRQRKDEMCWKDEKEKYNNGVPFKLTCRDDRGVVVTLIADNYYGYSKKEIKTQISYSANLYGLVEEEHAGGAIAFPRGIMSDNFYGEDFSKKFEGKYKFDDVKRLLGSNIEVLEGNYAVDKNYPEIVYLPEYANILIDECRIEWKHEGKLFTLPLSPEKTYLHPSGNKFQLVKHPTQSLWRIINTAPEGMFCHKPCTVSGGGKSEISKSMQNAIKYGPFNIVDLDEDFKKADEIIDFDYSNRYKETRPGHKSRSFLSPKRTLGSAVKLLTPSDEYNEEYNKFLKNIPDHIRSLVLFVKRLYRNDRETGNWKEYMSVEIINGRHGTTLQYKNNKVIGSYVRIGFEKDGNWLLHKLRSDFVPSHKIQMEDDITASITVGAHHLKHGNAEYTNPSIKFTANCEAHLFQRPDEAIIRGYDKEAEADISSKNTFLTNYEPLTRQDAVAIYENAIEYEKYTQPVKELIEQVIAEEDTGEFFVVPSHTRIVDGKPTANPRYLQRNSNVGITFDNYLAEVGIRLIRQIGHQDPVVHPVNAVLPGRRNNPADKKAGIRPLSVYNPIHYQELPELFMDFICSLTGKSPSTTGAGSEGALTKGPFNMLIPTTDLNNALLSYILTDYKGFSSAAGYVGSENRFDHDISILVPEIWSRLVPEDRNPDLLIKTGSLEKLEDFDYNGQRVLASRLGYRITKNFAFRCMNRLFDEPLAVFSERMLKPELQNMEEFVDGINNIVEAQKKVALQYFQDGSIEAAIPPLKVLLHIMAYGEYEGKTIDDAGLRKMFDRATVVGSDWYKARLELKKQKETAFCQYQIDYISNFIEQSTNTELTNEMKLNEKLAALHERMKYLNSSQYMSDLSGSIGADPLFKK